MRKALGIGLFCTIAGVSSAHADTFVIGAERAGHEATIKIPAGAVTKLSADRAESIDGYAGSRIEAMRLSGDVLISITGSVRPIEIKADSLVLELTADSLLVQETRSRADVTTNKVVNSSVLVGNVVLDLQTSSGPAQIRADKVEHHVGNEPGA